MDVVTDTLLDYNTFYGEKTRLEEFLDCLKDVIIEQAVYEEKRHNEWGYFSDSLSIWHWRELTKEK